MRVWSGSRSDSLSWVCEWLWDPRGGGEKQVIRREENKQSSLQEIFKYKSKAEHKVKERNERYEVSKLQDNVTGMSQ